MILEKKTIRNRYVTLKPFKEGYITKEFVRCLNNKSINKYLNIRHKKQTIESAKEYFYNINKNNDIYYAIFTNAEKKLIGTISLRSAVSSANFSISIKKKHAFIGFMICDKKFFGTSESRSSFRLFIKYVFNNSEVKKIFAGTEKNNISANFNLMSNKFKLIGKSKKFFWFLLEKKIFNIR